MSDLNNNEEKITEEKVLDGKGGGKLIYTIKCRECEEVFTKEQSWNQGSCSQLWPSAGFHRELRAELHDHKSKVHKVGANCSKCQAQLYDNSGKQFTWFTNEKHGDVCKNCLDELDRQGELWDNFFRIAHYTYSSSSSDPGMEGGLICGFCCKQMLDRQLHQKENGKWVPKHNCPEWKAKYGKGGNNPQERERESNYRAELLS
ncbi:protein of unknown function [endosymbiont DhMRE of Dentiscutata heterogama]|uniref:hypothetical protein n=1 Tax=endosymbiont DhMRE of Dentiscutata heterogama TaxID=1609546 RepID=UPI000629DBFC|nr:hypothetical protein [endosymbiont DhMRE of Dentiscutata heterogama]CFW92818.1 protein of unknown function [endosymbiont DhMRE of Dentiscutata heterogama]CFW93488.1 protein of unknown function [endosymbiont DhMRE of Dentiscutata heterogama]